ncbi:S8 family peptidase [Actinocorallia longicatena]|uniref:S8 family serine peptidase n=1 Tax=Actinocorallia longicatena TaxID=111803 RepID=A0ABP6QA35_9ACTN
MRRFLLSTTAIAAVAAALLTVPAEAAPTQAKEYVVLYAEGANLGTARDAVKAAGGTILSENGKLGVATVKTTDARFLAKVRTSGSLSGAAEDRAVGYVPKVKRAETAANSVEKVHGDGEAPTVVHDKKAEPLDSLQWDMKQIDLPKAHKSELGSRKVLVGIMDTGVDASHPDIKDNFDFDLSRNFTTDLPADANGTEIDGSCASDPDGSCDDPATVDENEHGTHVASTIASPINGEGITGVAPRSTIVNLRTGQDSGYFFLKPTLDALAYAGDHGIDVVNMSYYIDPWLWNCAANPADNADQQAQQRTIIDATNRALRYAYDHGVTLIAAAGNDLVDYTKTNTDGSSPDFATVPGEDPHPRTVPASCVSQPSEGDHVIPVSSTGISTRKAYYSSFGNGYVAVAAPGGDKVDTPDQRVNDAVGIWAAYPESVGREAGTIDANGNPTVPFVVKQGKGYYQSLQGTSMAAPHAVGVAALIISHFGKRDRVNGGLTLPPATVESKLLGTAVPHACPTPATFTYNWFTRGGTAQSSTQTCEGTLEHNGFYGNGIINAANAVS